MVDVFISYARKQRDRVEPLKDRLEAMGLDVFFDLEGIDGGSVFPDVITRALDSSNAVLCCWSPLYFTRPWCLIEAREGLANMNLVPVVIEPFERTAPPAELRQVHWRNIADWAGEEEHEGWNGALKDLGRLVGRDLAPILKKSMAGGVKVKEPAPEPPPATEARVDVISDLRATWDSFKEANTLGLGKVIGPLTGRDMRPLKDDPHAVGFFLKKVQSYAPGSGLEFEVEHQLDQLRRKAEARRKAEEERRAAANARHAAVSGRPASERMFRLDPPGVANWPKPEMVAIPPGAFMMGSPPNEERLDGFDGREEPQHKVTIEHPFALGKHTVTFAEWDAAIAAGAKLEKPNDQGWGRGDRPVINVSWDNAMAYLDWLNKKTGLTGKVDAWRLPSEAEWEYACRAGTTTPYSFGATISTEQANFDGNYKYGAGKKGKYLSKTAPVGSYPSNAYGLHDMHGNVWEWCADPWHENYSGAPSDGSIWEAGGDDTRRVLRGGSWLSLPQDLRSAYRDGLSSVLRIDSIGFRLARTL